VKIAEVDRRLPVRFSRSDDKLAGCESPVRLQRRPSRLLEGYSVLAGVVSEDVGRLKQEERYGAYTISRDREVD